MTEMLSKEQFVKAKRIRGGHRAHLTSTLNLCEESLQSYSPDRHDLRLKLKQLKITLEDKLKTLKTLDDQILQCVDEEGEIEEEITEAGKLKDSVYEVLVKIDDVLTRSEPSTSSSSTNNNNTGANANVVRGAKAKLPKLELKKFDGEAYNWQEFWDAFNSSIHENKDLNKVDKFNYLKSMLEGSAYATIAGISLTEANYDIAVNLLKERYAQKQVIINSHIDNILKLDPVSNRERDIVFENGHYTVKLPWREHHDILPANFDLSAGRLTSVLKRLRNDDELLQTYDKVIHDQIDSGIVEAVHPNLENVETGKVHYLSHHAVIRKEASTTKVRVVMDASAKEKPNSPSLNDCLHTGPSLLPNIIDILLRFRWHRVPLVADIEKAFHMIHVDEEDRNALRFLWIQDVNSERPKLMILRFCRIVFGLSCSPFLLETTLRHHITNFNFQDPAIANKLIQDMYVDDLVTGSDTVEDAVQTYTNAKECLSSGGFNLRKWRTSNTSLMNIIETDLNNTEVRPELSKVVSDQTTYAQQMIGEPQELKVLVLRV